MQVMRLVSVFLRAFVSTQRKTRCSKQDESGSGEAQSFIAIRVKTSVASGEGFLHDPRSCPCLTCSVKITQVGISEVIYSQGYGIDESVSKVVTN